MARLKAERSGNLLKIKNRPVSFDFWPTIATNTRRTTQSRIFVSDPFTYIHSALRDELDGKNLSDAQAYLRQAQDFFRTSNHSLSPATNPLLIYYSFLNLVRCYLLYAEGKLSVKDSYHGLSLNFDTVKTSLNTMQLTWHPYGKTSRNLFDGFVKSLDGNSIGPVKKQVSSRRFFSQILVGHRLWTDAQGYNERFVSVDRISFLRDEEHVWASLDVSRSNLSFLGFGQNDFLNDTGLSTHWDLVAATKSYEGEDVDSVVRFELKEPIQTRSPADKIHKIVEKTSPSLWRTVKQTPPYRKYYLLTMNDQRERVPQLASILAGFFIFGSIVRYRPQKFESYLKGNYGAFIEEFMMNQARQFLFLMASQFAEREVSKANIV
ncbi:MAG: YaaC family protein [Litorimonas sp.]